MTNANALPEVPKRNGLADTQSDYDMRRPHGAPCISRVSWRVLDEILETVAPFERQVLDLFN